MKLFSKYHKGERMAQELAGELKQADFNGQAIANTIIEGALGFIAEQEYTLVSITDDQDSVWASVLTGNRGFMAAPDNKTIVIDKSKTDIDAQDFFWNTVVRDKKIGMLIIELASRRRLRINGVVSHLDENTVEIKVKEAYPNCMKYIQRRHIVGRKAWAKQDLAEAKTGVTLDQSHRDLIMASDTFFIGSANPKGYLDVSHRGGNPGFVELIDNRIIRIPDYKGNSMFNTFGNFMINDQAGAVFWDFESGKILQLAGKANVYWDNTKAEYKPSETSRYWELDVENWIEKKIGRKFTWEFLDYSPHNPAA